MYVHLSRANQAVLSFTIMTYGLDAVSLTRGQYDDRSICWNNLFQRIFNMHKWESVKLIQFSLW